ncbi:pentapeptide repeat-containing protein [Anabaena cylindrica FACHB-243]|uniref:Pentapeptide repeat protein n=1 Tax=Anabaena cylindrica (strain ATCC 27899 / PCC 7122) TaxID=272123 RepID=K9ZQE9_ANACC|nr:MULTISPECIES: pentapeptide repeat-containing protein [Anabaena]AFZ60585.1 pentapeptide repeat protein [Anabaena cylindrica PCC 7122]MBD2418284.1 pentapeptide repeat-containing protein [Anabaena cylindrica FACHB-243]MBY5281770.1 pentapeptide repeat-containing protein [Anabaena sp. CCAP 1446/1C]MBY5311273.1 pentapeptide repeat-containing protein [Anabaena sp. CCAP 1446/1C]MCM2408802.1 pentapeptide repeat-containing protein [Anabaena sp. CCAP 1446/1C]
MPPDYSGQNLQGRSFKGQNLTEANFSKADIRGANFTGAILKGADFSGATSGIQRRWVIGLLIVAFLVSALSGFFSIIIGTVITFIFDTKNSEIFIAQTVVLVMVTAFCIVTIRKGLIAGIGIFAATVAYVIAFAFAFAIAGVFTRAVAVAGVGAVAVAFTLTGVFAGAFAVTVAFAVAEARSVAGVVAFAVVVAGVGAVALARTYAVTVAFAAVVTQAVAEAVGVAEVVMFVLFSAYIGWRSFVGDGKDTWIRSFAIAFAATNGTSFRGADLTDADLTGATLKNTDFRTANLTRTRFYEAKKLDFARPGNTILNNRDVLNLLVSCNGRGKSYAGANLRGANLIGADLKEANLKDADIIEATFQEANLEWANLALTQAVGTNFTNAKMTGACVEAWNIESTTKLDNVDCRFVYLLENPKLGTDDRERRPSSGEFQPGEFTKLFEEVLNTVDLIFRNGIDWKAFVNAFSRVQNQNEDTELSIQSIENKGDGVVVVKVNTPEGADKEKIHSDFIQNYQFALAAVEEKYKALLQAKDNEIVIYRQQSADMKEITSLLANKPISVQVDNKVENKNMTNSNDSSRKVEIGNIGRDFNASGQSLNLGEISGTVTNTINELPSAPEPEKPGIKEILTQLQTAIEADSDLTPKDKEKALKQVKSLAEAAQNPQEKQDLADTAITMLKGVLSNLPTAAKLVEECSKLLPLISGFLGLG